MAKSPDDKEALAVYRDPEKLLGILSVNGVVFVPDGTICFLCCRWQEGRCSIQDSCPHEGYSGFALIGSDTEEGSDLDKISDRLVVILKNSRQRAV